MLPPGPLRDAFLSAMTWPDYLASATPSQRPGWESAWKRAALSPAQGALVRSFQRRVNVLVISGTWCGDCVQQCPIIARIAEAAPALHDNSSAPGVALRLLDRDENLRFADSFKICGGHRVPVAIFLNEDFDFVSLLGDRTLARYRAVAARSLGPSCPLPGAPVDADELAAVTADWIDEFERVALLLRLSSKLRTRHND